MRMTKFFRSKSCSLPRIIAAPISNSGLFGRALESITGHETREEDTPTDIEEEEEEEGEEEEYLSLRRRRSRGGNNNINGSVSSGYNCSVTTPDAEAEETEQLQQPQWWRRRQNMNPKDPPSPPPPSHHQFPPLLAILVAALRKSLLVTCSVERDDVSSHVDIGCPTDVRHVSHVTFDPFDGFLGLPIELQYDLPRKVPSARGNSVPTILLMMQKRLYSEGGLQAEGIFRINAENSQEENVRNQLNKGVVPHGIDVHCLAGLIKAWFRELPTGVLDSLTPEQVMHCNTEEDCTQLVNSLPLTEAALLDWAINLMADIVLHENYNKMNARNVAMVFAPNMTQMADPLTALIHAVQVMNFLKTLIMKKLREREESDSRICSLSSAAHSPNLCNEMQPSGLGLAMQYEQARDSHCNKGSDIDNLFDGGTLESKAGEKWSFGITSNGREVRESVSSRISAMMCKNQCLESSQRDGLGGEEVDVMGLGGILDQLNLRKGVRRLCRHPVFQLSKAGNKKKADSGFVNGRGGGEAWD